MVSFHSITIKQIYSFTITLAALLIVGCSHNRSDEVTQTETVIEARTNIPTRTVKEVMLTEIEPATNALWAVAMDENIPQTDADWAMLEQAANNLINASHTLEAGGTAPNETLWAQQPEWITNNQRMAELGVAMLNSIHNKDYDGLLETGFILIEPCSACHMAFSTEPAQ